MATKLNPTASKREAASKPAGGFDVPAMAEYMTDAWQRSTLYWDVMRQRGDQYRDHMAKAAPNVLDYEFELIVDGRELPRPVNYGLVRILPSDGQAVDPGKRPFVVIDPRAGHGPGIGGFKADSEIGVALQAGHPCYFIGFLPDPVPGQTIEDIAQAEAQFLETIIARQPDADGKPCVIGNCQAGWAVMILAAIRPELFGPIIIAGSPLSYWAGVRGRNPMRYSGGLLGGSWLTALTSDLGGGVFDGAWLVQNFENQNPANTYWTKQYNLYSKIDTEAKRYLDFEQWWGGHVCLNAEEMQFIVDELFVGNKLASGGIQTSEGTTVDLRSITSPIVVFCSQGDNITPPQQALGWILDLYDDVEEIRKVGQTIVYAVHDKIGHLGIFVSAGVARKEHREFATNIDLIDLLPPGLYEAVFEPRDPDAPHDQFVEGDWIMRCEARSLDDIRALGGNSLEDERRFETAARVSEINLSLYRTMVQPFVQAAVTPWMAESLRRFHPLRVQYELLNSANPAAASLQPLAERVRNERQPVTGDNPFLKAEQAVSSQIVDALDKWRQQIEALSEAAFHSVYGTESLQSAVGIDPASQQRPRQAPKSELHRQLLEQRLAELETRFTEGGRLEAMTRALIYLSFVEGAVDERSFAVLRQLRSDNADAAKLSLQDFKKMVRDQFYILLLDERHAVNTLEVLLPAEPEERHVIYGKIEKVVRAGGDSGPEIAARLAELAEIFGVKDAKGPGNVVKLVSS